ncbi:hypothetical protein JMG10_07530 [Nostoc ellipsosporum NOK]|nr:hypothetical protein [Nostoc ellipsosporum NOK]
MKYLLIGIVLMLASCGTLRKNKAFKKHHVKTENAKEVKETKAAASDSAGSRYEHNTDSTGVVIEFSADAATQQDSLGPHAVNQVILKPDGTIEAKGHVKSLSVHKKQTRSVGDSTHILKRDTASRQERAADKTEVVQEEKTKQVKRSTLWYMYALALTAGIFGGLYIDYRTGGHVLWWIMGLFRRRRSSNDRAG